MKLKIELSEKFPWQGLAPNPQKHWGFLYAILDHTTGEYYLGRKQLFKKRRVKGCKSAVPSPCSKRWKSQCWTFQDYSDYWGSSNSWDKHLKEFPDHEYSRHIIALAPSKGTLHLAEACLIFDTRGLIDPMCFNRAAPSIKFRVKPELWELVEVDTQFFRKYGGRALLTGYGRKEDDKR